MLANRIKRIKESWALRHFNIRVRIRLLNFITKLILPLQSRAQPGLVKSIVGRMFHSDSLPNIVEFHQSYPASLEKYNFPENFPPAFHREYAFQPVCTYLLKNVLVGVRSGYCFTDDGILFGESYESNAWEGVQPTPLDLHEKIILKEFQSNDCLTVVPLNIYYHFLIDAIPRLLRVLSFYPDSQVVIAKGAPRYALEILDALVKIGKIKSKPIYLPHKVISAVSYAFSATYHDRFVRKEDVLLLRNAFLPLLKDKEQDKRIYISRRFSPRALHNEDKVEEFMRQMGFTIIYLEHLPWVKQVELFSSANFILASHGGGLANLIWSHPGTKVVEIIQRGHFNDCFARLACQLQLEYGYLFSKPEKNKIEVVDIDELRDKLLEVKNK